MFRFEGPLLPITFRKTNRSLETWWLEDENSPFGEADF